MNENDYSEKENKKPITLRLDENDVNALKQIALEQGLSYQSLISSILHKYVDGAFVEKKDIKLVLEAIK